MSRPEEFVAHAHCNVKIIMMILASRPWASAAGGRGACGPLDFHTWYW